MTEADLVKMAQDLTRKGPGGKTDALRRAFLLAHHARRLLERAAEQASHDRWKRLEGEGRLGRNSIERYAQSIASSVTTYPVIGEARVYAAMLDAADRAASVSGALYTAWLDSIPERRHLAPLSAQEVTRGV